VPQEGKTMYIKRIKEQIDLAILANGGEYHQKVHCQCDPEVGFVPCEYCAVFNGLNSAKDLISYVEELETKIYKLRKVKITLDSID